MEYSEIEPELKRVFYNILRGRTAGFLDLMDIIIKSPGMTIVEAEQMEQLKSRGKSMFMECQTEILTATKCIMETGECPEGIDKRAGTKLQNTYNK